MFYALLAISLMALDYRGQYVDHARAAGARLIEPLMMAVDLPGLGLERFSALLRDRSTRERELRALRADLARARAELGLLTDLAVENDRLRILLDTARRTDFEFITANIAGVDLNPFAHRLALRRGRRGGVRPGMPVMDENGVIGQVESAATFTARIVLISDPDHALPVQILPSGERTIAYGSGSLDRIRLTDLPMNTDIQPGDRVVTSGLGGRFPPGLPVARIETVRRDPGALFADADAAPLAAMGRNRIVLLLDLPQPGMPAAATEDATSVEAPEIPAEQQGREEPPEAPSEAEDAP